MIITKKWLNEWIDVSDISTDRLCEIFNSIGLEVDSVESIRMPKSIVVGYVKEKSAHPNADKLSVCKVDVGDEVLDIVCGAKNVAQGQYVPVAKIGTKFSNGLEIKPTVLRGENSNGMICSSSELGLAKLNDGIMVLDDSLGDFSAGTPACDLLDDDVIELELTANRGDCLSVRGVARDLRVVLGRELKSISHVDKDENVLGIGRILSLHVEGKLDSELVFKVFEFENIGENILMQLRLKIVGVEFENLLECVVNYATYATGVLFRLYDIKEFKKGDMASIKVVKNDKGFDEVRGEESVSLVGYNQLKPCNLENFSKSVILEANYIKPDVISRLGMENKDEKSDFHYYRSSRGSEPDLNMGLEYLKSLFYREDGIKLYGGMQEVELLESDKIISFEIDKAMAIIGQEIPKNEVVNILKGLGFGVIARPEQEVINIEVPPYRHDISDMQDICEEIVRIVGIDNIEAKPYYFCEKSRQNYAYKNFKKRYNLRYKSVGVGFFESVHYVFDDRQKMEELGLRTVYKKRDIANPITKELNTLRSTLALHLIEAASNNIKNSKSSVALFEIGKTFSHQREEQNKIGWIFSGFDGLQSVQNHGKPSAIDFASFIKKIGQIVGEFELVQSKPTSKLYSPYEFATIVKDKEEIGIIGRLHVKIEDDYKLPPTYFCECDFDRLKIQEKQASSYSKFPISTRELSLLVPKDMPFLTIKEAIKCSNSKHLVKFYPIDLFQSQELGDNVSLSVKFVFQDKDATLSDESINASIDEILKTLDKKLDIRLR